MDKASAGAQGEEDGGGTRGAISFFSLLHGGYVVPQRSQLPAHHQQDKNCRRLRAGADWEIERCRRLPIVRASWCLVGGAGQAGRAGRTSWLALAPPRLPALERTHHDPDLLPTESGADSPRETIRLAGSGPRLASCLSHCAVSSVASC